MEGYLAEHLPQASSSPSPKLHEAMRYAVLGGGKRFRSALIFAVADTFDLSWNTVASIAGAVECLHAYSLVHDDLPAMDNDLLRRGKPTCHVAFGEAAAILVGDSLHALAFEYLLKTPVSDQQKIAMLSCFSKAIGFEGMVGGQAMDCLETLANTQDSLEQLHRLKTGALIRASLEMALLACGMPLYLQHKEVITQYGDYIGLAFQIQDDILDFEEQDAEAEQPSYLKIIGLESAKKEAQIAVDRACSAINPLPKQDLLSKLAFYVIERMC